MKYLYLFLCLIFLFSCSNTTKIPSQQLINIDGEKVILNQENKYKLIVRSAMGCPPCKVGLLKINQSINKDCMTIFALEDGDYSNETIKSYYGDLTNSITFITHSQLESNFLNTKIFPKYFLYNSQNELVWEAKGANELDISLINSIVNCN